jgi:hypothetical protein
MRNSIVFRLIQPLKNLSITFGIYYHLYHVIIRSKKNGIRKHIDMKECAYKKAHQNSEQQTTTSDD